MKTTSAYAAVISKIDLGIYFLPNVEVSTLRKHLNSHALFLCTPKGFLDYQILRHHKSAQIGKQERMAFLI